MTSKEIYQSIDQSKISPQGRKFLKSVEKNTKGFTQQNDKVDSVMKNLYADLKSKKPEALKNVTTKTVEKEVKVPTTKTEQKKEPNKKTKIVKKKVKKATGKKKVTKPTKTPSTPKKGKVEHISTRASKLAKKEGISFKEARAKLSKEAKEQIKKEEKQADKELDKLLKFVRKDVFEDGEKYPKIYGKQDPKKASLSADAKRMAKPVGKRVSKNGKTYYEYRDNRSDRNSLPAPKGQYKYKGKTPPYLADGGAIDSLKKDMNSKLDIHSEYYAKGGRTISIVNDGVTFDKSKYKAVYGDFDKDGTVNIDDANPLDKSKSGQVEQVELRKTFDKLLGVKAELDEIMYDAVETLDEKAPEGADIYARTKTPYSILKKLVEKRMLDPKRGLTDMIGTTIAVDNQKELEEVRDKIDGGLLGKVLDRDDFYKTPNAGYRAYHYIVEYKGVPVEVQLKTKNMKKLHEVSHEAYKNGTLNAKSLDSLSKTFMRADKGDAKAKSEISRLLKDKKLLASKVSKGSMAKGGKTDEYVAITLKPKKSSYKGGKGEVYKNMQTFYDTINAKENEDKYDFIHSLFISDSRKSDPQDISEIRVNMIGEKSGFDDVEKRGLYDLFDLVKTKEEVKDYAKGGEVDYRGNVTNDVVEDIVKSKGLNVQISDNSINGYEIIGQKRELDKVKSLLNEYNIKSEFKQKRGFGLHKLGVPSQIIEYAKGGKIGFDGLAKKVAKSYEGTRVPKEFQEQYGKTYNKKEAMEVGKKVAGKVYRQQQAMEKGGKTKQGYDYVPQEAIDELSYTMGKVSKSVSGSNVLSGAYVKSGAKAKTKSKGANDLTKRLLAMTDDEDKTKIILEKDVKAMQKYVSDKLITAFYLGLPKAYDFKGDYSYGGGIINYRLDAVKKRVSDTLKNIKANKFEMGLKYPQYDFEKLLGKPIIKDVFGKTFTFNDGSTEKYKYRLWIWKDCVIGQTIGSESSRRGGYTDYTYGEEPTLIGGYKSVQTSKASKLESIIEFMAKDKNGFVKDNDVLYNGLGGATFETLDKNKIKYEAGGTLPTPFGQAGLVGETGAMNEMDLFAMGGGLPQGVHQYYANTYNPAYPTPHGYAKGGEVEGGAFDLSLREKSAMYKYLDKGDFTEEKFMKMFDKNEPQTADIIYYWAESRGLNTPQSRRLHKSSMKQMGYAKGGMMQGYNDRLDESLGNRNSVEPLMMQSYKDRRDESKAMEKAMGRRAYQSVGTMDKMAKGGKTKRSKHSLMQDRRRVSSEPWEVAYQKRKSKMEAGGTLPTPFGQAGLVGETGAMNEMDMFAMGGGLPQGVHQYYANTYNPAYPTPHGYAKGGKLGNAWQNRDDVDYFSVDVDTEEEQYRDFQFKDYDDALKKYKEITSKDTYEGEKLDNVQLVVVFEDGDYETELMKFYDDFAKGGKIQGYNDKLDESLGNTKGKRSTKEQNYKDRRNESEAMEKKGGKRKYARVKTMDKGNRKKRQTPMSLAKEIRKEGEKWQDAVKRASAMLKKK